MMVAEPKEGRRVLVVAPHADDMEFGCAGYVSKLVEQGLPVTVAVMMVGAAPSLASGRTVARETREKEMARAAQVLGVECRGFDLEPLSGPTELARLTRELDDLIEALRPSDLLVPLSSFHQDHEAVWQACLAALRPSKTRFQPRRVLAYEYPMSVWGNTHLAGPIQGTVYVPLTYAQLDRKLKALACHESQVAGRETSLGGAQGVRQLAEMRGVECGALYAEKFHLLREIL